MKPLDVTLEYRRRLARARTLGEFCAHTRADIIPPRVWQGIPEETLETYSEYLEGYRQTIERADGPSAVRCLSAVARAEDALECDTVADENPNLERAARGRAAVAAYPDFGSLDYATAAADTIADILHSVPASAADEVLERGRDTYHGDAEDGPLAYSGTLDRDPENAYRDRARDTAAAEISSIPPESFDDPLEDPDPDDCCNCPHCGPLHTAPAGLEDWDPGKTLEPPRHGWTAEDRGDGTRDESAF